MKYFVIAIDNVKDEAVLKYLKIYAKVIDKTEKPKEEKPLKKKTVKDFKFTIEGFDITKQYGEPIPFRDKSQIEKQKAKEWQNEYENY